MRGFTELFNTCRLFVQSGHMVWNKLCFGANNAVGLSKQRKIWPALYKFLCFVSATALHVFASQHNFFRTTWPDCAKGLLSTFHYYLRITGWTLVYNVPEAFHTVTLFIVLLVSLLNVGVSFSLC